jgi:hypothetical protein
MAVDPDVLVGLHPWITPTATPATARIALLNHIAERVVLYEPMPSAELIRGFVPAGPAAGAGDRHGPPAGVPRRAPDRLTLAERADEPAQELVGFLSWLMRRVDQAIR